MKETIRVTVLYFSHVRYALGRNADALDVPIGATVADVEDRLRRKADGKLDGVTFRLAVNREYVGGDRVLTDGDEVALIAPVQGG